MAAFGLANGPVSWAIYAWRNALVFHSLDKMTSIVIHLSAPLVLYAIRWFPPPSNSWFITYPLITHNDVSKTYEIGFFHSILIPMSVYLIWQAIYCYIILDLKYENVLSAKTHATSFSWISKDFLEKKTDSIFTKVANWVGPKNHLYLFLVMNFLYALVTLLPTVLFYRYFWLHTAFIVFIINISIFNGADYYMEVFSRQYLLGVEKQMAQEKLVPVPMLQDLEIKKTS